jgi:glycosyltransferase involved in cell wall biosynthesis
MTLNDRSGLQKSKFGSCCGMRILILIAGLNPVSGGPVVSTSGMAVALKESGADVRIVSTHRIPIPPPTEMLSRAGVPVRFVGPTWGPLHYHGKLKQVLQEEIAQADIVIIHGIWESIQYQGAKICQQLKKPYVIRPHGMLTPWSLGQGSLKKNLYISLRQADNFRKAHAFSFTAEKEAEQTKVFLDKLGIQCINIVEPVGVDQGRFGINADKNALREKDHLKQYDLINRPVILFLGRIHPGKGLEYLVPAMAHVSPSNAVLLVVGPNSGHYKAEIESVADRHGVRDRIIFAGIKLGAELSDMLACADIFCLPSDHENFGIAIIEALAAGTPAIISREVAIYEDVVNAGAGVAIDRDPKIIGQEITKWLADPGMRARAAENGIKLAREKYDWHQIAMRLLDQYQKIIEANRSQGQASL